MRALLIALAVLVVAAPAAEARKSQFTIFEAGRELRSDDAGERARLLDEVQAFGVRWIRIVMYWRDVGAGTRGRVRAAVRRHRPRCLRLDDVRAHR
jgi:hypothetical protein